jgi:probable rRNA maturation factor
MRLRLDVVKESDPEEQRGPRIDYDALSAELGAFAERLAPCGCRELSAALSFVTSGRIRELNAIYRGVDEETDVLSFPLWEIEGGFSPENWEELPLGDIVVSPEYVFDVCENRNIDYNDEIILVIIHGALHLLGFDHDSEERELEMWREQEFLRDRYFERSSEFGGSK